MERICIPSPQSSCSNSGNFDANGVIDTPQDHSDVIRAMPRRLHVNRLYENIIALELHGYGLRCLHFSVCGVLSRG